MTLLVALTSSRHAILIADRRVTCGGVLQDDEFNKLCVLFCDDAKLALAFTGLATFDGFDSSTWLANTLSAIATSVGTVADILAELMVRASSVFPALRTESPRVTILACGYVYWGAEPEPRIYLISNSDAPSNGLDQFSFTTYASGSDPVVVSAGVTSALPAAIHAKLAELTRKDLSAESLLRFAVLHMRNAASSHSSGGLIGEQFNAAVLKAPPDTVVTSTYHSARGSRAAYGANVVVGRALITLGIELIGSSALAGGEIRKQDPCWCGSGLRFKHCHLKKFGAVYFHAPEFRKPMSWIVEAVDENPRPSGRRFCVASSFA